MRQLIDAPRKKKQWTEKEEAYLQDKWGTVSIKGLSKALGRSENAIIVRAQRLGCGAHLAGDTRISLNQLMLAIYGKNMLGYTSDKLIRYGLPVKWHVVKKNRFRVIDIDAFWNGIRNDNRPENLQIMNHSDHLKLHWQMAKERGVI